MKHLPFALVVILALFIQIAPAQEEELTSEQQAYLAQAEALWNSLDQQQGEIALPNGVASLNIPESFNYLNPDDAKKILVEVWGNPEDTGGSTLGMLFPAGMTPFDESSWGVTIQYEEDGYVSDEDADEINYDELLAQMKEDAVASSKERVNQGYEPIELIGWASEPFYDRDSHKLHWAQEIKIGDYPVNTLNYNIRILGRKGVLVLNFIASMNQKALIESKVPDVLALAEFDPGSRYDEFDPSIDKIAAYGLGALVAGKVLAKTGFLVVALVFLKKFGIVIFIAVAAVLGKLFKRKTA